MKINSLMVMLLFVVTNSLSAQNKYEYEESVKAELVPENARSFIEKNILDHHKCKVRWFLEKNEKGTYYECKLRVKKEFNSIKFDSSGTLYDIEIIVDLKKCAPEMYDTVQAVFENNFKNHKIEKVQLQYTGQEEQLKSVFYPEYIGSDYSSLENIKTRFEIEVKGKKNGDIQSYEYLFDLRLGYIRHRKILRKTTDHLNY